MATTVQFLRSFSSSVFSQSEANIAAQCTPNIESSPGLHRTTRTVEAFAAAVDGQIRRFDTWCAYREEAICRALGGAGSDSVVVSLLSTEKAMHATFQEGLDVTLQIVRDLCSLDGTLSISSYWPLSMRPPSKTTTLLLDALLAASRTYSQRGDQSTASLLMQLFIQAAEPTWKMVGQWLQNGMGIGAVDELEAEFFIERNDLGFVAAKASGLFDPDFWAEGYTLREGDLAFTSSADATPLLVPAFLAHVSEMVLASGKAKGLLRAMDMPSARPFETWGTLQHLVVGLSSRYTAVDWLAAKVEDTLRPYCQASDERLSAVLVENCGLLVHLHAIEDLYLMRRGDSVSHFLDLVFAKVRRFDSVYRPLSKQTHSV